MFVCVCVQDKMENIINTPPSFSSSSSSSGHTGLLEGVRWGWGVRRGGLEREGADMREQTRDQHVRLSSFSRIKYSVPNKRLQ